MWNSFTTRITAWYLLFFSFLFLAFSAYLYFLLERLLLAKLDEMLAAEAGTAAALFESELGEVGAPAAAARETVSEMHARSVGIRILDGASLLAAGGPGPDRKDMRSARRTLRVGPRVYTIAAATSVEPVEQELRAVRRVIGLGLPVMLLLAAAGGYFLTRRGLGPLARMEEQARHITDRSLDQRLEIGRSAAELAGLAATFNELLGRLDASFDAMRRFMADASHELRTPISVIRGEADVALSRERTPQQYRETLAIVQDEAKRLTRLVEDLLRLARADAGHVELRVEEFYLNDLLGECCRSMQALASSKEIALECRAGEDASFRGDEELLRRLVLNLLDNAIRYTPQNGRVTASLERCGDSMCIRVADTGIGISAEAVPHVFERFYRGDPARSRSEGGFGLGLAIVKWIAESHHGTVEVESVPGTGSRFTVLLPA